MIERIHGLLRALHLALRLDRRRRGRPLRRPGARSRRTRPARRSAPRAGRRRSWSTTRTGCSIPLKRTRPKGDPDPGWQRISWDEALDLTAASLRRLAAAARPGERRVQHGLRRPPRRSPTPVPWIQRLMHAFGSPNLCVSMELCGWGRSLATRYHLRHRHGRPRRARCPTSSTPAASSSGATTRASPGSPTRPPPSAALKRGARLIVVDPRRAGLANKADVWLRVRPGTDGALALGIAHVMIERGWYDRDFVRDWTNGPLLVRADTGRLLTERDLVARRQREAVRGLGRGDGSPAPLRPGHSALRARRRRAGPLRRRTRSPRREGDARLPARVRARAPTLCRRYPPETVEAICWVAREPGRGGRPAALGGAARRLLRLERRRAADQRHPDRPRHLAALRAHRQLRRPGRQRAVPGRADRERRRRGAARRPSSARRALGLAERPLGPVALGVRHHGRALPRHPGAAALPGARAGRLRRQPAARPRRRPARARGAGGARLLRPRRPVHEPDRRAGRRRAAGCQPVRARGAQDRLRGERGGAVAGPAAAAGGRAARRGPRATPTSSSTSPAGSASAPTSGTATSRPPTATSSAHPASRSRRCASNPGGVRVPLQTRYRKYAEEKDGVPHGFATPTRKIELYSETFLRARLPAAARLRGAAGQPRLRGRTWPSASR